jgi:HAE1 family hydrophobic/amphiphilic exporter-1
VILVVFVFIQDLRSTLIPAIAIPVSLIGTFAGLLALGTAVFSGMVAASILVPLFVPMFYAVVQGIRERVKGTGKDQAVAETDAG